MMVPAGGRARTWFTKWVTPCTPKVKVALNRSRDVGAPPPTLPSPTREEGISLAHWLAGIHYVGGYAPHMSGSAPLPVLRGRLLCAPTSARNNYRRFALSARAPRSTPQRRTVQRSTPASPRLTPAWQRAVQRGLSEPERASPVPGHGPGQLVPNGGPLERASLRRRENPVETSWKPRGTPQTR